MNSGFLSVLILVILAVGSRLSRLGLKKFISYVLLACFFVSLLLPVFTETAMSRVDDGKRLAYALDNDDDEDDEEEGDETRTD